MGRIIPDTGNGGDFPPMVGLQDIGNYVKGKVEKMGMTSNGNPYVTLSLIDLEGTTSRSVAKGQYEEVEVNVGDMVQVIGSVKQLRDKLPQLAVGDVTTITFTDKVKVPKGIMKVFKIEVE